jgi:hypothetical protein
MRRKDVAFRELFLMLAKTMIVASVLLAGLATTASAQTSYEPSGNFQALWSNPAPASAPQASRAAGSRQAYALHPKRSAKKPKRSR